MPSIIDVNQLNDPPYGSAGGGATKLPLAGGTMSGAITLGSTGILMTGIHVPATTDRCITNLGGGNDIGLQAPAAGAVKIWNAGNGIMSFTAGGPTMSNKPLIFPSAIAAGTSSITHIHTASTTNRWYVNVPTGGYVVFDCNGSSMAHFTSALIRNYVPVQMDGAVSFSGSQTSAGASVANIYRDSSGSLNRNVATGASFVDNINGTPLWALASSNVGCHVPIAVATSGFNASISYGQLHRGPANGSIGCTSISSQPSSLSAGGVGGTYPEVVVHGNSETGYEGAVEIKTGKKAQTNDGTWTNFYNLAKGSHHGQIRIYDNKGPGPAYFAIGGTSLGVQYAGYSNLTYVVSGAESTANIAWRISGGYIQINVGTGQASDCSFSLVFEGMVV